MRDVGVFADNEHLTGQFRYGLIYFWIW